MKTPAGSVMLVMLANCGTQIASPLQPRDLFPAGAYAQAPSKAPCLEMASPFYDFKRIAADGPPPIPGDDATPTFIDIRDESKELDVAAVEIIRQNGTYRVLYAGVEPTDSIGRGIAILAGDGPTLQARVLLRSSVRGGLFAHLSYCYEFNTVVTLPPSEKSITLVIEDRTNQPPRFGSIVRFDPPYPVEEVDEDEEVTVIAPTLRRTIETRR